MCIIHSWLLTLAWQESRAGPPHSEMWSVHHDIPGLRRKLEAGPESHDGRPFPMVNCHSWDQQWAPEELMRRTHGAVSGGTHWFVRRVSFTKPTGHPSPQTCPEPTLP